MEMLGAIKLKISTGLRARRQTKLSRSRAGNLGIVVFLLLVCAFMGLPLLYTVIQAFKPIDEIFLYPPRFFVRNPTLDNFYQVGQLAGNLWVPFSRYLFNSVFITVAGTALYMLLSAMAGYSLGKGHFWGKGVWSVLVVWALLFRHEVTEIPAYVIVSGLGMVDTYFALILPALSGTIGVFLIRQFVLVDIPDSTLEAARIDGASEYRIFRNIVLPGIKPAMLTVMIFSFQAMWRSGTTQYIFSEELKQLPTVLSSVAAGGIARAGAAAAASVVLMLPPIAVFLFAQNSVMETMTHSGLK